MSGLTEPLAIVIPAYKARFLPAALASIATQTVQQFHVYVCDDGSPEDLKSICNQASIPASRLTYLRFEPNTGARHLVRHWNRSVQPIIERWIWLFSDDDLMEPACVESFLRAVELDPEDTADVYRFNTLIIDAVGKVLRINPPHPARESALQFIYHRLTGQRQSYAPDYIFRGSAWKRSGGFVEFPFAQGSDDASWITFAGDRGFRLVAGPCVRWRRSESNITSNAGGSAERVKGALEFAVWLERRFTGDRTLITDVRPEIDFKELLQDWIYLVLRHRPVMYSVRDFCELPKLVKEKLGMPAYRTIRAMVSMNCHALVRKLGSSLRRVVSHKVC